MTSEQSNIIDLVKYLVTSLVDNPEVVAIDSEEDGNNLSLTITAHQDDVGKLIGRNGRTIKTNHTLARSAGSNTPIIMAVDVAG